MCSANPKWFTAAQQLDATMKKSVAMYDQETYDTL
jgi:hypothetical protein